MEDTQEELYVAADSNISEAEAEVAFDLLNQLYDELVAESPNEEISQPHVEIGKVFAQVISIQAKLNGTRSVFAEAMADCEAAGDAMLRVQDLIKALDTVSVMLNRIYYGSVDLVMTMGHDQELYDAAVEASKKIIADYEETAEASA